MQAMGRPFGDGWASSPNAAYYASLDGSGPVATPPARLPGSLTELLKMQQSASDAKHADLAELIQNEISKAASDHGIPLSGNIINVKA